MYADWIADRERAWREQVRFAALDPFRGYAAALRVELPDAARVLDAFHVVRLGNQALDEVRRRVQQQTVGRRGHTQDPLYQARRLLLRGAVDPRVHVVDAGQVALDEAALLVLPARRQPGHDRGGQPGLRAEELLERWGQRGFEVLPRRWVVERSFSWITSCRRLACDYERTTEHSEAMAKWAMIALMARRLARLQTGALPAYNW